MPNEYWLRRLIADRKLAERTAAQVSGEVRRAYRTHYLTTCKKMEELYLQVQGGRTPGRTKLWEYSQWRKIEPQLRQYCEAQSVIQVEQIDRAMAKVFKEVIGQDIEKFGGDKVLVRYDPRAVIDTAWSGEHFSARVWRNTAELAERIRDTAQQIVMGEMSPGVFKRQLMKDYGVCAAAAERLVDTEVSYVLNKANLTQYQGRGFRKLEIVNLDVNTCEKCKALEGEVFDIRDVPVLPIHPRCHCSYCVPEELDEAEITASGANLDEVYARHGVKGYESAKQYAPKGALERKAREMAKDFDLPEVKLERAAKAAEKIPAKISIPQAPAAVVTPLEGGGAAVELPGSGASEAVKIPGRKTKPR